MAKNLLTGIEGSARKAKRCYLGMGDASRKIKKMYVGDSDGKARLFYSAADKLGRYGTATALSSSAFGLAAATAGDYALFGGGYYKARPSSSATVKTYINTAVNAYSSSLTKSSAPNLPTARYNLSAASVGDYALFAGGQKDSASKNYWLGYGVVDAYDRSLTLTTASALTTSRYSMAAVTLGEHALFAGGLDKECTASNMFGSTYRSLYYGYVDAYDASLTRTSPQGLSVSRSNLAAAVVGDYALFAGGEDGSMRTTVDVYDRSLTRTTVLSLSTERTCMAGASNGKHALFAGGKTYNGKSGSSMVNQSYNTVDVFTSSLTRVPGPTLSKDRSLLAATTIGDYALFGGGDTTVDVYTLVE